MMKKLILTTIVGMTLTACTNDDILNAIPDNRPDYRTSSTINPLEVPPDLTQSSIDDSLKVAELSATSNASLADYSSERSADGRSANSLEKSLKNIQSSGDATWIEIDAKPSETFENIKRFWLNNGLKLSRVDANIGIMETDWLQNKSDLPTSGISALLSRAVSGLVDDGVRDKFRTRVDYDGQRSYVYLTHYGASEKRIDESGRVIRSDNLKNKGIDDYTWVADSRNPELEVEMLRRLNLFLLKSGRQAAVTPTAEKKQGNIRFAQLSDGTPALMIDASFNRSWLLLGIAIDRAGYNLIGQTRKNGLYSFEKVTERKTGFIIKKTERDIESYQIGLADQGDKQIAVVRRVNNQQPTVEQATAILQKISQEIQF